MAEMVQGLSEAKARLEREKQLAKTLRNWANRTRKQMSFQIAAMSFEERTAAAGELRLRDIKNIKTGVRATNGFPNRVNFSFPAQGMWVELGVGAGRKKGSAKAKSEARPWISSVLEPQIRLLADLVADSYADIVSEQMTLRVPGYMKSTIVGKKNNSNG